MYQGSVNEVTPYFVKRGFPVPANFSTSDWMMNVAQATPIKELEENQFFQSSENVVKITESKETASDLAAESSSVDGAHVSLATETFMLYQREIKALYRDVGGTLARFGVTSFLAVLIGTIFYGVGKADPSVPSVSFCWKHRAKIIHHHVADQV